MSATPRDLTPQQQKLAADRRRYMNADQPTVIELVPQPMPGTWFVEQRLAWISETLRVFGYINRKHLVRKFDISLAQAAVDFRKFQNRHPSAMKYDTSRKVYVSTEA